MLIFFYKSPPFVSQISPEFTADEWVLCCVSEFGCAAGRQSRSGTSVINAQQRAKQKSFDRRDSASFLRRCVSPHSHQGLDFTASGDASAPHRWWWWYLLRWRWRLVKTRNTSSKRRIWKISGFTFHKKCITAWCLLLVLVRYCCCSAPMMNLDVNILLTHMIY